MMTFVTQPTMGIFQKMLHKHIVRCYAIAANDIIESWAGVKPTHAKQGRINIIFRTRFSFLDGRCAAFIDLLYATDIFANGYLLLIHRGLHEMASIMQIKVWNALLWNDSFCILIQISTEVWAQMAIDRHWFRSRFKQAVNAWSHHQMGKKNPHYWPFVREFTGYWWNPRTKARDAELLCFLWSVPE